MEFVQFHPPASTARMLITEGARGEAVISQLKGERSWSYAPTPRIRLARRREPGHDGGDREGRGVGPHDYIALHLEHLGRCHSRTPAGNRGTAAISPVDVTASHSGAADVHYNMEASPATTCEVVRPKDGDPDSIVPAMV